MFAAKRWRAVRVAFAAVLADGHGGSLNLSERLQAFLLPLYSLKYREEPFSAAWWIEVRAQLPS
jgi:hypothetical protein